MLDLKLPNLHLEICKAYTLKPEIEIAIAMLKIAYRCGSMMLVDEVQKGFCFPEANVGKLCLASDSPTGTAFST